MACALMSSHLLPAIVHCSSLKFGEMKVRINRKVVEVKENVEKARVVLDLHIVLLSDHAQLRP